MVANRGERPASQLDSRGNLTPWLQEGSDFPAAVWSLIKGQLPSDLLCTSGLCWADICTAAQYAVLVNTSRTANIRAS